ncbi:hypothetical protein [Bradyrhizobium sp.]|uniref:hypothetical protein n=1 Tax=Bradyrhizobium sp. TaxID=376 RepID=UPI0026220486|nr:hypothetical protein [Bradyrhizobium sp.]
MAIATIADDILAGRFYVDAEMAHLYQLVRASLALEGKGAAARLNFDDVIVERSYRVAHDDESFRISCQIARPPARCGWIEWASHGQDLGLWWQCDDDETLMDVCCFLRTPSGETAMIGALKGYRFESTKLELTYSKKMINDDANAVRAISDYLRFFSSVCALLNSRGGG